MPKTASVEKQKKSKQRARELFWRPLQNQAEMPGQIFHWFGAGELLEQRICLRTLISCPMSCHLLTAHLPSDAARCTPTASLCTVRPAFTPSVPSSRLHTMHALLSRRLQSCTCARECTDSLASDGFLRRAPRHETLQCKAQVDMPRSARHGRRNTQCVPGPAHQFHDRSNPRRSRGINSFAPSFNHAFSRSSNGERISGSTGRMLSECLAKLRECYINIKRMLGQVNRMPGTRQPNIQAWRKTTSQGPQVADM